MLTHNPQRMSRSRLLASVLCSAAGFLAVGNANADVAIKSSSTRPAAKNWDADRAEWKYSTPTASDTITWKSGVNVVDWANKRHADITETKFNFPGAIARNLAGFRFTDSGVLGSSVSTIGGGLSDVVGGFFGTTHVCNWSVGINGTLGREPRAFWSGQAYGDDPYLITADSLAESGITEPRYDIFIPVGLEADSEVSAVGRLNLNVFYDTAEGTVNLLRLVMESTGSSASSDVESELKFYALDTIDEGPTMDESNRITLDEIKLLLESDLGDSTIDAPLYIGIVWEDIPVPTVDMGGGALARFRAESSCADAAANTGAPHQGLPWLEDFDVYAGGDGLIGQSFWTGFDNDPAPDGIVNPFIAGSRPNSLDVQPQTNVVREFDMNPGGKWRFQTQQFIPGNFQSGGNDPQAGSYIVLFDDYNVGGPHHTAVVLQADSNDQRFKCYFGDPNSPASIPYIVDQWVPIDLVMDFDNDFIQVFYAGQPVCQYQWTTGAFGDGNGQLEIAGVSLFGNGSSSVFHDDMIITPLESTPAALTDVTRTLGIEVSGGLAELQNSDDQYYVLQSGPGFNPAEPHPARADFGFNTGGLSACTLDLTLEASANIGGPTAVVLLNNWSTGQWDELGRQGLSPSDRVLNIYDVPAQDYIDANGRIEMRARSFAILVLNPQVRAYFNHDYVGVDLND